MSTYISSEDYEKSLNPLNNRTLCMNPWTVQNLVYEMIVNHYINNDPVESGFPSITQKYDPDPTKSSIFIDIANNWQANTPQKRPAIFVFREAANLQSKTLNQMVGMNAAESETEKLSVIEMPLGIACISTNVGHTEQIAEFTRIPFRYFEEQIRNDFCFRRFKLVGISKPQIYVESKDHFIVVLSIQTVFDDNWVVKGDDLKIKTIGRTIFDKVTDTKYDLL